MFDSRQMQYVLFVNGANDVAVCTSYRSGSDCRFTYRLSFFSRVREIANSDCYIRHVCPSVRIEQLGSHWTDFHEIWYLSTFPKI
jgi:hypothetical protein